MKPIKSTPVSTSTSDPLALLLNKVWSLDNQLILLLRQGQLTLYDFTRTDELVKLFQGLRITNALSQEGNAVYGLAMYTNLVGVSFLGKDYKYLYPEASSQNQYIPVVNKGVGEEYIGLIMESAELVKKHPYICQLLPLQSSI